MIMCQCELTKTADGEWKGDGCGYKATQEDMLCDWCRNGHGYPEITTIEELQREASK